MSRGVRRCVAAAGVAAVLSFSMGVPAAAVTAEDGLWYVDAFHLADAHNAGLTGEGVTIAVIDSQINPNISALRGADITVREPSFCVDENGDPVPAQTDSLAASHGTNVASYIVGNGTSDGGGVGVTGAAPGATIKYYAALIGSETELMRSEGTCDVGDGDGLSGTLDAFNEALDDGVDIISVSVATSVLSEWDDALVRAARDGVVVVKSLPNEPGETGAEWLASANSVVAVQAIDADGDVNTTEGLPNSFDKVTVANAGAKLLSQGSPGAGDWTSQEFVGGTSLATPLTAGFLAVVKQKYPDATGNQLIQSLIHNTGAGNPDLDWDDQYGYGVASLTAMLEADPSIYPDVNPLIVDEPGVEPAAALFVPDASMEPTAIPAQQAAGTEPNVVVPIVVGAVGLLVLAGVIVFVVFVRRRPRQRAIDRIQEEV